MMNRVMIASLRQMTHPPLILAELAKCTVILCDTNLRSEPTWEECKDWLFQRGYASVELKATNGMRVEEVIQALGKNDINSDSIQFAGADLGVALYAYLGSIIRFWVESSQEMEAEVIEISLHLFYLGIEYSFET